MAEVLPGTDNLTAERIVNFFEAWTERDSEFRDETYDRAANTYLDLKRRHDFSTAARLAKIAAVREIMGDEPRMIDWHALVSELVAVLNECQPGYHPGTASYMKIENLRQAVLAKAKEVIRA